MYNLYPGDLNEIVGKEYLIYTYYNYGAALSISYTSAVYAEFVLK